MSQPRHMWADVLTSPPNYSPSGIPFGQAPSHVVRGFPFGDSATGSRRLGSSSGFVSVSESMGHWLPLGSESGTKSPLSNFGFLKNLTSSDKKTTRDGQTPKRRGPKPDSKPALTRRQELNRQAQRTHRERKEMYIKALEQEVLRLKDTFSTTARERDAMAEENRRLKELLIAHGISFDVSSPGTGGFGGVGSSNYGGSSTGSISGSYGPGSNSTGYTSPPGMPPQLQGAGQMSPPHHPRQQPNNGMDYDQVGIDFVLTLERPCMDHMQFLMVRAVDSDADVSGHALMATCPPESHIIATPDEKYPHQMPDIKMPDLLKLLDLSNRLPLDGEITPIMAWAMIMKSEYFYEITKAELEAIKMDLLTKVRCYGFGAVLEEFEVRDAIMAVSAAQGNTMVQ